MAEEYTKITLEKVETAKRYIEKKYSVFLKEEREKAEYIREIEKRMTNFNFSKKQIKDVKTSLSQYETMLSKFKRKRTKIQDFEQLGVIGKGSFGEVRLCRDKRAKELVAIKRLSKKLMVQRKQINHVSLERQLLSTSQTNFIIQLKGCFQDDDYLYFIMEYLPGGDLMNLLIKEDILDESAAQFYMVEIVLAVQYIHKLGYIHRDLKPDNILIGKQGHIKVIDFGLVKYTGLQNMVKQQVETPLKKLYKAVKVEERINKFHKRVYSRVGTPEYIAPQVLTNTSYDQGVDCWSLGIIFFEMLFGYTPFSSDTPKTVCYKIINWKDYLEYPEDIEISIEARSLLAVLLCDRQKRFNIDKIKSHRFFRGVNWKQQEALNPPFVPKLTSDTDTSNFQQFQDVTTWSSVTQPRQKDYNFTNFDYKKIPDINVLSIIDNQIQRIRIKQQKRRRSSNKSNKRIETQNSHLRERFSSPKFSSKKSMKKKCTNFLKESFSNRLL